MTPSTRPLPVPDGDTVVFWDACNQEKLVIQRCQHCENYIFYPRAVCPRCMSSDISWVESSGHGRVYSYTVAYRPAHPAFTDDCPYIVALIELEEGVRVLSNVIKVAVDELYCEMPVEVVFLDIGGMKLPLFQPDSSQHSPDARACEGGSG
ncbi:Zn-ribbon domain-containing OB-fold protein [Alicyclobacillus sp. ALC3]|uniref:Zn-ribbon domain-containing OB-fold protein n=1 Tax=Alicyclobacillus sp. ALC3 TaxID=2796143 RepID=UPI0027A563D5|nr:Zn-ribbon domain-containing OB-fold protein [Alicyclobacillus sp. ALC3]